MDPGGRRLHDLDPAVTQLLVLERLDAVPGTDHVLPRDFRPLVAEAGVRPAGPKWAVRRASPKNIPGAVGEEDHHVIELRVPTIAEVDRGFAVDRDRSVVAQLRRHRAELRPPGTLGHDHHANVLVPQLFAGAVGDRHVEHVLVLRL